MDQGVTASSDSESWDPAFQLQTNSGRDEDNIRETRPVRENSHATVLLTGTASFVDVTFLPLFWNCRHCVEHSSSSYASWFRWPMQEKMLAESTVTAGDDWLMTRYALLLSGHNNRQISNKSSSYLEPTPIKLARRSSHHCMELSWTETLSSSTVSKIMMVSVAGDSCVIRHRESCRRAERNMYMYVRWATTRTNRFMLTERWWAAANGNFFQIYPSDCRGRNTGTSVVVVADFEVSSPDIDFYWLTDWRRDQMSD